MVEGLSNLTSELCFGKQVKSVQGGSKEMEQCVLW